MSGPRQRGSTVPLKALELAEAGCASSFDVRTTDSNRATSSTFVRRRKASSASVDVMTLARAKIRRFLIRLQRRPLLLSQVLAYTIGIAIILGIILAVSLRYMSSDASTSHDRINLARRFKSYAASKLNRLPSHSTRNREGTNPDTRVHSEVHKWNQENRQHQQPVFEILISSIRPVIGTFHHPSNNRFSKEVGWFPDYGGLEIVFFEDHDARRFIAQDLSAHKNDFRDPDVTPDDDVDAYYFFDDDYLRGLDNVFPDEVETKYNQCRKIAEHTLNFQNCNEFHQLDPVNPTSQFKYLNEGAYRQVFSMIHPHGKLFETIALKDISVELDISFNNFEFVRMDAIVAERLSASPRIYDIYGFCGVGILSEYFYHGDIEGDVTGGDEGYMEPGNLQDETVLKPQNDLTGIQKLVLALEMAEALADLHGYANGMIVHDDVQLSQYLFNEDKTRLKLNDFNRAEFRLFDETTNQYCHWKNGPGNGSWRAPEEYADQPLTEQIDVWSLGNNMYTVLTGLNPLYEEKHTADIMKRISNGDTAYIDPRYHDRSPSEAVLAELIPKCHAFKPEDRPTIFELVDVLKVAVSKNMSPGMTRAKVLHGISTEI